MLRCVAFLLLESVDPSCRAARTLTVMWFTNTHVTSRVLATRPNFHLLHSNYNYYNASDDRTINTYKFYSHWFCLTFVIVFIELLIIFIEYIIIIHREVILTHLSVIILNLIKHHIHIVYLVKSGCTYSAVDNRCTLAAPYRSRAVSVLPICLPIFPTRQVLFSSAALWLLNSLRLTNALDCNLNIIKIQ